MSTLKYKLRDGWNTLYGGILSRVLRKDRNLAELTDKSVARQNLELNGDNNTTHYHDSRYVPLINEAKDAAISAAHNELTSIKSVYDADISSLYTGLNSLSTTTSGQITTINNNITSNYNSLKQYVDNKIASLTTLVNNTKTSLTSEMNNIKNRMSTLEGTVGSHTTTIANHTAQLSKLPEIYVQSAQPSSPKANAIWFRTNGSQQYISVYVGGKWVDMGAVWK